MNDAFERVVAHIFNNWTALKLAVEHSMAGTDSKKVAVEFMNYVIQYCLCDCKVDVDSIQEILDDIMDQEFDTICEDGSTKEIAVILHKFLELLHGGNTSLFEEEYSKLQVSSVWITDSFSPGEACKTKIKNMSEACDQDVEANVSSEIPMEQDAEWTEVKSRRKR